MARLHGEWAHWKRWWLAIGLVLFTHPLLDAMTVYGTQLALPFSDYPYAVGSVFIIDPLYTLPLLIGAGWALAASEKGERNGLVSRRGMRANAIGLALSTAYLAWSVLAQQHVTRLATATLAAQGIVAEHVLVTPGAFNSLLWRVVVVSGDSYLEGFHSLLDRPSVATLETKAGAKADTTPTISFERYPRGNALAAELAQDDAVRRIRNFSKGFYALRVDGGRVRITDLRVGQEPNYIFSFAVAERHSPAVLPRAVPLAKPEQIGARPDIACGLPWIWRRMWANRCHLSRGFVLAPLRHRAVDARPQPACSPLKRKR